MNPYESPESQPTPLPKERIKNIWTINRADLAIVGGILVFLVFLLLVW